MPSMIRYSVIYGVTHDRSRLSEDCTEPGGGGRVLPRRIAGFLCRSQEICLARLASRGVGKSGCLRPNSCRFLCGWERWDTHIRPEASDDALTGALRTAWKLRTGKNAKTSRKNGSVGERSNR